MDDILSTFNSKTFADQLHTKFKVRAGSAGSLTLQLVEVNAPSTPPNIELFSLLFRGPSAPRAGQGIHRFEHEKLGGFDLFMTSIGADDESTTYEVIFHRLRTKKP